MMTNYIRKDHRVNVGLPEWLYEDLKKLAENWGGDVSKQIRFELLAHRGQAKGPSLPIQPSYEHATRRRKAN